ncbi:MAG: hypothetical protein ACLQPH_13420 [Acidimicrobiales bacterium]
MRPEPNPIASDARRVRRTRRLPEDAACALCGEQHIETLAWRKVHRTVLEGHHAAVESNDEFLIVVLCLNCHARATALQQDVGVLIPGQADTFLERLDRATRSLGSFFELLAQTFYGWADKLAQVVGLLDQHCPAWRTIPGMP